MRAFRVLIADPDPLLLAACRIFLVGQAIDLTAVTIASECWALAQDRPPDLLIIDPELPGFHLKDVLPTGRPGREPAQPPLLLLVRPELLPEQVPCRPDMAILLKPVPPALLALIIGTVARAGHLYPVEVEC